MKRHPTTLWVTVCPFNGQVEAFRTREAAEHDVRTFGTRLAVYRIVTGPARIRARGRKGAT